MKQWAVLVGFFIFCIGTHIGMSHENNTPHEHVGEFLQEVTEQFSTEDGLPQGEVYSITTHNDIVYAGTENGLYMLKGDKWQHLDSLPSGKVTNLSAGDMLIAVIDNMIYQIDGNQANQIDSVPTHAINDITINDDTIFIASNHGFGSVSQGNDQELNELLHDNKTIHAIAINSNGTIAIGATSGLFTKQNGSWQQHFPHDKRDRSWAPRDVKAVTFDQQGDLWFGSPQGVGNLSNDTWTLFTGQNGLPYNQFTDAAPLQDGVCFATDMGLIYYRDGQWNYRQGPRWTPANQINAISISNNEIWMASPNGVGVIRHIPMTLAEKAAFYEQEVEQYIKRTEYGYLSEVRLPQPGDKSEIIYSDSDNDGLWTSMYGAGECFAYAATQDPAAKQRAQEAFAALKFLSTAPEIGEIDQQPGYVARTVIPTTEPNPNERSSYTLDGQQHRQQTDDSLWKAYYPRFVKTQDGNYWYKTDTSSDELDGHYFFYPLYYDLVAETEAEKADVREVVRKITDHLIHNDFALVDHDGTPTRWANYSPEALNHNFFWYSERGLKSLSILSYLAVAEHITGDYKYGDISKKLRDQHAFDTNAMITKVQNGIGSGNQSDDEMAIMCYYNLIKYTKDEALRDKILYSFYKYWIREFPEKNPFFNFAYAALAEGESVTNPFGVYDLSPWDGWLKDSLATLKGFPLDRLNWSHQNSHRLDIQLLEPQAGHDPYDPSSGRGYRVNGKVIPIENRHFNHWNTDPWRLDYGGDGRTLASGAVYLLPYYMGLYHGFIVEAE